MFSMRIPVVDQRGIPLMPCTAPKARALLKAGNAHPKRNKLGLFYLQLTYDQEPANQRLVVGIDPGSKFEGFCVVGTNETVCNLMVEAPTQVKQAVQIRRRLRRARRFRLRRRPCRSQNRSCHLHRLPPSTRSRWEAKARIVRQLATILPLSDAAVEDVQAATRPGIGRHWNRSFSPVQIGKEHLYGLLKEQGLSVHLYSGIVTSQLREHFKLAKSADKAAKTFSSHAVDAWVLGAATGGAKAPTSTRLWYSVPIRLVRRQLHRMEPEKGGRRSPYGGTRSLGFTRGTLVRHPRYGRCLIGGWDHRTHRVSLHACKSTKRLTQQAADATGETRGLCAADAGGVSDLAASRHASPPARPEAADEQQERRFLLKPKGRGLRADYVMKGERPCVSSVCACGTFATTPLWICPSPPASSSSAGATPRASPIFWRRSRLPR